MKGLELSEQEKITTKGIKHSSGLTQARQRLLAVGPLPPPPDGTSVSFQVFCRQLGRMAQDCDVRVINSSPRRLKDDQTPKLSTANFAQAGRILWSYCWNVPGTDQVMIFGSNGFLLMIAPLLLMIAKLAGKPCYLRAFGGSLDTYYDGLGPTRRRLMQLTLNRADGLIVQTRLLHDYFCALLGDKVHLVPGYRPLQKMDPGKKESAGESDEVLRLVFLGHVREEKGILVLLESMRKLSPKVLSATQCDIYGPIYETFARQFEQALSETGHVTYKGVVDPDEVVCCLSTYDALVFPTFYKGEGHPGVLIESMVAGIPVITTNFRSIPEIIKDGVNGMLVTPGSSDSLTKAIERAHHERSSLKEMGRKNWERRTDHDASEIVPLFLDLLDIGSHASVTLQVKN